MSASVRELFYELVETPGAERERILAERRIPADVCAAVESLLSHDSASGESLTRRVSDAMEETLRSSSGPSSYRCGAYRLVQLIGSGGMGAVYLAERRDGEIEQKVAIKLLRADSDRPAWRDRFLRERQLLAYLNHPSIARLLDVGHTGDGRPYLVMEYVEGVTIDEYAAPLDLRAQLKLFLLVCDGVSHAHRHLIIHRDLKPSNILVDSAGHPKLLDFGIAKLLDITTDDTRTAERLLTPNYASPEQLRGDIQSTATDVYSLGAVLYKLLTGRSPREPISAASSDKGMAGERNITAPSRLNPKLPRDIDHILRKALRYEPDERYASVDAFAEDIRAFLESRPVQARSGDMWYRTRKVLRRYWMPVAAAAIAIAGLCVGIWAVNRERVIAQQRFVQVRQLANKLFEIDVEVRRTPGTVKARQLIVDSALQYLGSLAAGASREPDLALDLGTAYMRAGRVQGVPIGTNLGQMENAEKNLRIAEGLIRSVLEAQPANRVAFLRAAQIAHDRMVLAQLRRPNTEALRLAHESEAWLQKYLSTGPVDEAEKVQVVIIGMNVANWYVREGPMDDGRRLLRDTIEIARTTNQPAQAGAAHIVLARAFRIAGDLDAALAAIREGVRLLEPPPGKKTTSVRTFGLALRTQGEILGEDNAVSLDRPQDATRFFERGLAIYADLALHDASESESRLGFASGGMSLAGILRHSDPHRAISIYEEALRRLAEVENNSKARRDEVRVLARSTWPLRQVGRSVHARQRLDAAFSRLRELKLYPAEQVELGSEPDDALRALAEYEAGRGNVVRGVEIYQQLLEQVVAAKPKPESRLTDAFHLSSIYRATAALHRRDRRADLAAALGVSNLELWRHWDRKLPNNVFVRRQLESARIH